MVSLECSVGELFDKATILEIKAENIKDSDKLTLIFKELNLLNGKLDNLMATESIRDLYTKLKAINQEIWNIEDAIRIEEKNKDFGDDFIVLARSVYKTNDRRAALKLEINNKFGSEIVEVKSYEDYE